MDGIKSSRRRIEMVTSLRSNGIKTATHQNGQLIEQNSADIKELQDTKNGRDKGRLDPTSCLPERLSTFTGREKEIKEIKSSLVENDLGIVSIIGGPGFGKSTIAIEVAHRLSEEYKIPVIFSYQSTASTVPEAVRLLCHDIGIEPGKDPKIVLDGLVEKYEAWKSCSCSGQH